MKEFFQACNTVEWRWNRKKFLLYPLGMSFLLVFPLVFFATFLSAFNKTIGGILYIFVWIAYIYCMYVSIAAYIKRFHDLWKSGWFFLFTFIPFVNLFIIIWAIFFKGTTGTNEYGADPLIDKGTPSISPLPENTLQSEEL